ncbi:MAG: hypothetical protein R3D85_13040 [Paracoccaceae bacterium]
MIALTRIRSKQAIPSAFRGKTARNRLVKLMRQVRDQIAAGQDPAPEIDSLWKDSKPQMIVESSGKCAYCESAVTATYHGDVEHFRPKSVYWWLAYVYDNYLLSCAICNQTFKGDRFALAGTPMPAPPLTGAEDDAALDALARDFSPDPLDAGAVAGFAALHRAERTLIPNPYFDAPEPIFAWEVFAPIGEVWLRPNPAHPRAADIVAACERIFGLNRPDLLRRRYELWEYYDFAAAVLSDPATPAPRAARARELIDSMTAGDRDYAAMVRYFEAKRLAG